MDDLDKIIERKQMQRHRGGCWYVTGSAPNSSGVMKSFLLGPYPDAEAAMAIIERKRLSGRAEVCECPTSDLARAGQIIRARRLQGNTQMSEVFNRYAHKNVGHQDGI